MNYCTLFDSNYADRGIVMIKSLSKVDTDMDMYVLCMDELCHSILASYNLENTHLITLQ